MDTLSEELQNMDISNEQSVIQEMSEEIDNLYTLLMEVQRELTEVRRELAEVLQAKCDIQHESLALKDKPLS